MTIFYCFYIQLIMSLVFTGSGILCFSKFLCSFS